MSLEGCRSPSCPEAEESVSFFSAGRDAIFNSKWLLVWQPAKQNSIKQPHKLRYYIQYKLFSIRVRVRVRVDFIQFC